MKRILIAIAFMPMILAPVIVSAQNSGPVERNGQRGLRDNRREGRVEEKRVKAASVYVAEEEQFEQQAENHEVDPVVLDLIEDLRNENQIDVDSDSGEFDEDFEVVVPVVEEEVAEDIPIYNAEEMPTFQGGGIDFFRKWVMDRVQYPRIAQENNITGKVTIRFVIERDGSLTGIEEVASPDISLTEEVMRVLKQSPKWSPGKMRGHPVRVYYILPVEFGLIREEPVQEKPDTKSSWWQKMKRKLDPKGWL